MPATATSSAPQPLEMIEAMTVCAYELGLAAGEMAKRAEDTKRFLAMSTEFRHCFFAMRMGIRMRHWSPAAMNARESTAPAERRETERPEAVERPEPADWRERAERLETERDREGDYEPVSLPKFLKSLGLAAANAEARRDELPAHIRDTTLPTLHGLLRQANARPDGGPGIARGAPAVAVLARAPAPPATRSRLLASTGAIGLPTLRPTRSRRDSG